MTPIVGNSQSPTILPTIAPPSHPHGGSYVQVVQPNGGKNWQKGTIEMLPDDTLLEIFDFYRVHHNVDRRSHGLPWKWYRLAHVCRRWRHVISTSPRRLDLQIFCKSSKPIERVLHVWPTLPVVVQFRGRLKSKSLPKNVVIALRQTDRVCKIDLSVPTPIRQSIADMMQVPFPALESILIESKSAPEPLVIDEFLGDSVPRLKEIRAEGFAIPFLALRRLLLFTDNLVTLKLYDIPESCSFPPDALVTILSSSDHLNDLLVRFHPPASRLTTNMEPPLQHSTFPSLISLDFYGASEYLDAFVARAHMPVLDLLTTGFFNQAIFEIPHLSGLLSRLEGFKGLRGVSIRLEEKSVAVRFSKDVWTNPTRWHLSIQCRQLDWQLSFITQIFDQLSPLLSGANWLELYKPGSAPTGGEDVDPPQWLEFFQSLPHFSKVQVGMHALVLDIVHALVNEDMAAGVLPSLTELTLFNYQKSQSTIDAAERFVATRKFANQNIVLRG